jgi:hypothetical protein
MVSFPEIGSRAPTSEQQNRLAQRVTQSQRADVTAARGIEVEDRAIVQVDELKGGGRG